MLERAQRQSALDALHLAGRAVAEPGDAAPGDLAVVMGERRFVGKINLRADPANADAMAAVRGVLGFDPPTEPNTVAGGEGVCALWLGPDEWLLTAPGGEDAGLLARLDGALAGHHASVVDVSDARTVIVLRGARARDVLAKGCGLDLHPRRFRPGRCAQTALARASILVHQTGPEPAYDIYVDRSFAQYLWTWLEDAAAEFGFVVVEA